MASLSSILILTLSLTVTLLISPAHSQICASQKLNTTNQYANCSDLPTLNATLHYTYNASNSSLSIAFTAKPAKPDGWAAWGVNLNGTGMIGGQALVAMKSSSGAVIVKKFNLKSYSEILETTTLGVEVWDVSGESMNGDYVIFAKVKVPESLEKMNQIWQVGSSVSNGFPKKHEFGPSNLNSKATINLVAVNKTGTTTANSNSTGSGFRVQELKKGYQVGLLFVVAFFISFW
ncbi:auxin-induced in root cultures protein 12-like [Mercurialis annua]|uniref:auxin-induced in root cultures protein 12-like n=1 Tax=Mercurialis annua TaxID=3986 RepID=UPI00215FD8E6|nr:auxin-induced in root cultures protein 12-like [Mercurialis annua]